MPGPYLPPIPGFASPAPRRRRIAIVAGEASGDLLGSGLVQELRLRFPEAEFAGVGGEHLRAAGVETWHDCAELAVMGLAEVLRHLPRLLRLRRTLRKRLLAWQPDVFIGVDAPDFNLGLEKQLKRAGVRTVHYVSPSVWAWREGRAAKLGRSADLVLCLFPMEPPIYQRHGVNAQFVGHPLADAFPLVPDRAAARAELALPHAGPLLALLPGSRLGEIERMLPTLLEAARFVSAQVPGLAVAIPAASAECRIAIDAILHRSALENAIVFNGQSHALMVASDVVLLASGTAALEAMLAKRPMVVGYRISALTYRIVMGLGLMKVNRYSLPNVLANEPIVPELMQDDCTPENLGEAVMQWFRQPEAREALLPRYVAIHEKLRRNASATAAEAVAQLMARR
ncbi:MAG: lipid-A-disaccharide synthase [Arenimonas sp.]|nr:lipid-A-disaccharide synthase [Arenimonas sp.]